MTYTEEGKRCETDSILSLCDALDRGAVSTIAGLTFYSSDELMRAHMRGVRCLKLHGSETGTASIEETLSWAGEAPVARSLRARTAAELR